MHYSHGGDIDKSHLEVDSWEGNMDRSTFCSDTVTHSPVVAEFVDHKRGAESTSRVESPPAQGMCRKYVQKIKKYLLKNIKSN